MADDKHTFAHSDQSAKHDVQQFSADGQVSEGPSSMSGMETSQGGADSVPDTPDTMPPVQRGAAVEGVPGE